jgi:hypothetical protein
VKQVGPCSDQRRCCVSANVSSNGIRIPRRVRNAHRVAFALWVVGIALIAVGGLLLIASRSAAIHVGALPREPAAVWETVLALTFPTIGALVAAHQPSNLIGWTFCAAGLTGGFAFASEQYGLYARHVRHGALPWGTVLAWAGWIWLPALATSLAVLLLLFPDGRLLSRHWRPAAWLVVTAILAASWGDGPRSTARLPGHQPGQARRDRSRDWARGRPADLARPRTSGHASGGGLAGPALPALPRRPAPTAQAAGVLLVVPFVVAIAD